MKKLWIIIIIIIIILAAVAAILPKRTANGKSVNGSEYTMAAIERGEIITAITSTGTLEPVSTVDVGTQVSGIIDKLYVDYNDTVEKGQLIAELDRTVLSGALDEAVAIRNRAKALFDLADAELKRNEPLFKKGFISEQEFIKLRTEYITQEATLQSAEASVKKARTNLQYATITSPIKGTVVERNIERGQTVAASFSAPILFVIAEDLKRMQILASVDEADIGGIHKEQEVRFTVQAFPDKKFSGVVEQIRLQPTVSQNVVTYTVVIATENVDGTLLPGMTATVDFIMEKATDVLMAPNAALRFQPTGLPPRIPHTLKGKMGQGTQGGRTPQGMAEGGTLMGMSGRNDSSSMQKNTMSSDANGSSETRQRRPAVWILSKDNTLRPVLVKTGITDGKFTEISSRESIPEGTQVVTGVATEDKKKKKSVSLLPQQGPRGRR
jgi:HlyD family secretion protein